MSVAKCGSSSRKPGAVLGDRVADATQSTILALAFSAGVALFYLLPRMPPPEVSYIMGILAVAAFGLPYRRVGRPLAAALLGSLWALLQAGALLWSPFPEALARAPLTIEGHIASLPEDTGYAQRFLFRVERTLKDTHGAEAADVDFRGLVRLSWYGGPRNVAAGELWRLPVRLKAPHGFANPGGFDYERWLFESGITATGNVRKGPEPRRLDPGPGRWWLARWRQRLSEHLASILGTRPGLGLVQALTIGERSGLDPDDWELLTRTGTNHLVAISGLHVGLIAAAAFFLVRRLWALSPRLALTLAAPRAGALAAMIAAFAYAGLAGFAVSTQRALIMLGVVLAALFWQRTLRPWYAFSLALAGVLLLDPRAVLSYGAWLSFGAVAALLFGLGGRLPGGERWSRWGRAQWVVALGLLPLLLALFGRASLVSPLVNLIAVPLFSLVLLPLVLMASLLSLVPGLDLPLVWTADLLARCLAGLDRVSQWPWAAASLSERPLWVWAAAVLGVAVLLAPRGLPARWLGILLLLPVVLLRPPAPGRGEVWLTLLDVGQGLSAVIRTRDGTLVYDTGPGFASGFNTGSLVLVPYLQAKGIAQVDVLVLSHADQDHTGGARGLLARVPVLQLLGGEPHALGLPGFEQCRVGQGWSWSGVRFEMLQPAPPFREGNDSSCVLRVEVAGRSILLTGDIGRTAEAQLLEAHPQGLASDVLVAAHHGSASSNSAPFLQAVDPGLVLYSAGFANAFGFPARDVTERVGAQGARSLTTSISGSVELRLEPDGTIRGPWSWRERTRRLWTHRPQE